MSRLLACGSNSCAQLGLGHFRDACAFEPVHLDFDASEIDKISCGGNHTILLRSDQSVWAAGANNAGQLVASKERVATSFERILPPSSGAIDIACTWNDTIVAFSTRLLLTNSSQVTPDDAFQSRVRAFDASRNVTIDLPSVRYLSSSFNHWVCVCDAQVFGGGKGSKGRLGSCAKANNLIIQIHIAQAKNIEIVQTACTSEATIFMLSTHKLVVLGGAKHDFMQLQQLDATNIISLCAGWSNVYLLCSDNTIITAGRKNAWNSSLAGLHLRKISAGSEHLLAVSNNYKLLICGWNEHGNCSQKPCEHVLADSETLQIYNSGIDDSVLIQGGCATSWIVVKR